MCKQYFKMFNMNVYFKMPGVFWFFGLHRFAEWSNVHAAANIIIADDVDSSISKPYLSKTNDFNGLPIVGTKYAATNGHFKDPVS